MNRRQFILGASAAAAGAIVVAQPAAVRKAWWFLGFGRRAERDDTIDAWRFQNIDGYSYADLKPSEPIHITGFKAPLRQGHVKRLVNTGDSTTTLVNADPNSFEVGMRLTYGAQQRGGVVTVTSVNRASGVVTLSNPSAVTESPQLETPLESVLRGLRAWEPDAGQPPLFGLNRTHHTLPGESEAIAKVDGLIDWARS